MKKIIYLALLTGGMHSMLAMDQEGSGGSGFFCVPYGQRPDDQAEDQRNEQAQEVNLGIVDFFSRAENWFAQTMDALDQAVGAGAVEQQAQQAALAPHIKVVQDAIAQGTLPHAIEKAAKERSPNRFLSLLIGMQHLGIQPTNDDSASVIQQRLQALKLARRQNTKEVIEELRKEEQREHNLRKQYFAKAAQSDDETYQDTEHFVDSILNDEK